MERANTISGMSGGEMSPKTQRKHDAGPLSVHGGPRTRKKSITSPCPALIGRHRYRTNDGTEKNDGASE